MAYYIVSHKSISLNLIILIITMNQNKVKSITTQFPVQLSIHKIMSIYTIYHTQSTWVCLWLYEVPGLCVWCTVSNLFLHSCVWANNSPHFITNKLMKKTLLSIVKHSSGWNKTCFYCLHNKSHTLISCSWLGLSV